MHATATPSADIARRVEAAFTHIHETRMHDVPILNTRLSVAARGFQTFQLGGHQATVGALITPWFINYLAIADDPEADGVTTDLRVTETVEHVFPSGGYPFLICEEDALGRFAMCSLFSPVQDFEDQAAAMAVADAALEQLFDGELPTPNEEEQAVATMWQEGRWVAPAPANREPEASKDDRPPSRRALITAGLVSEKSDR